MILSGLKATDINSHYGTYLFSQKLKTGRIQNF